MISLLRLHWALIGLALLTLGYGAGCGGSEDEETGRTVPASYWSGKSGAFCRTKIEIDAGGKRAAAGLMLNRRRVAAGGVLQVRIRNLGREALSHGAMPIVQQRVDDRWERRGYEEDGRPILFPLVAVKAVSGSVGGCKEVPISTEWKPGQYRVAFEVDLFAPSGRNVVMRPWGQFTVVSPRRP
jgi:hypothetical protein